MLSVEGEVHQKVAHLSLMINRVHYSVTSFLHAQTNGHAHADRTIPVSDWTVDDVALWLQENGFERYINLLTVVHRIDGCALLLVSEADLRRPPLSLTVLGDIKHLALCIKKLKANPDNQHRKNTGINTGDHEHDHSSDSSTDEEDAAGHTSSASAVQQRRPRMSHHLSPEFVKLAVSYVYMFVVFMLTAFVMVVVHDRVPDMDRYPPLPDIVLDNLPYIPWAFELCELTAISMSLALVVILVIHKHRFVIMRRIFALTGTVFMLRCITMLITSLSVPGIHLQCQPKVYGTLWSKLERAMAIWTGFGMSLKGVRSCGDYMFSGHTVIVTLLNHFITEYTPRRVPMLHTVCWILNIFAVFFILAAHEHYSIDVFIAFYISSRLFLYYHSLANSRVLRQPDHVRTRTWFPLFSYFESSINGIVPNEYEWPLPAAATVRRWFRKLRSKRD